MFRKRIYKLVRGVAVIITFLSATGATNSSAGPRIIFFGDSLTEEATSSSGFITLIREGLRSSAHLDAHLEAPLETPLKTPLKTQTSEPFSIVGAGNRGDTVHDLARRLEPDVLKQQPNIVVILIGINDIVRLPRGSGTPIEPFIAELRGIVNQLRERGIRTVLATPPVIGEDNHNQFSELLLVYRNRIEMLAKESGASLVDLRNDFLLFLSKKNYLNKSSGLLTRDGVHLSPAGNELVAKAMLPAIRRLLGELATVPANVSKTE